jgi:hypothetical protein
MKLSRLYLGESAAYQAQLDQLSASSLANLLTLAQRIAWGIVMGPRVGVDIEAASREILRRHGDHFAAYVAAALVSRWHGRQAEADRHVERARQLLPAKHPWARLVPDEASWRSGQPAPALAVDEPGRVYRIVTETRPNGAAFGNRGVGRLLRMRSGELVFVNPVELSNELAEEIRSLGEVTHIVAPAKYHSDHANLVLSLFPKARLWGVEGHRNYPNVAHVSFHGYLSDDAPLFPGELEHVTLRGVDVGDVWLVDRASKTLITTDAVFLTRLDAPGAEEFRGPFSMFYAWAWGVFDRVGVPSYQPVMWTDIDLYRQSLQRALALDFDHVASCHGSWRALSGGAKDTLSQRLGWILDTNRVQALVWMGDFVRRHPGMFVRLIKEQLAARTNGGVRAQAGSLDV